METTNGSKNNQVSIFEYFRSLKFFRGGICWSKSERIKPDLSQAICSITLGNWKQ